MRAEKRPSPYFTSLLTRSLKQLADSSGGRLADPPRSANANAWVADDVGAENVGAEDEYLERRTDTPHVHIVERPFPEEAFCEIWTTDRLPEAPAPPPGCEWPHEHDEVEPEPLPAPPVVADEPGAETALEVELPRQPPLPPPLAALRDSVMQDLGRPAEGEGKIVVLASVQAEIDLPEAVRSLAHSLLGGSWGGVLAIETSASLDVDPWKASPNDGHGFTSLLDGTRKLEEVLLPTESEGVCVVQTGHSKGEAQVADATAMDKLVRECRLRFPFTIINGADWQSPFLPITAKRADAVYLVVRAHVTEQAIAQAAVRHLDRLGAHVRGCILTGATRS